MHVTRPLNHVANIHAVFAAPRKRRLLPGLTPKAQEELLRSAKTAAEALLVVVGTASLVSMALVAPNALHALHYFHKAVKRAPRSAHQTMQALAPAFYYLKKKGYIRLVSGKKGLLVQLTGKGVERVQRLQEMPARIARPSRWDGKWWVVAGDIPTREHRQAADLFRLKVKELRLYPLQRTLWLYPFDPRAEMEYILNHFGIARFVTCMEVSRLDADDDKKARAHFRRASIL